MKNKKYPFVILFVLLLYSCAQIVAPTGGPEDITPPEVLYSVPENYSSSFNEKEIRIDFNEFVTLKGIHQDFLSSPLLKYMPEFRQKGKSIIIEIEDTLRENTTYTFNFANTITDFTAGNPIKNYEFVFSTGDYVDSLTLRGEIVNAEDLQPKESVVVMLYEDTYDSIPYKEQPTYLAKVGENGSFAINNLSNRSFKIFALIDKNQNYIYDLPNEEIAFLDSLVRPEFVPPMPEPIDTSILATLGLDSLNRDSLPADSLAVIDSIVYAMDSLILADSLAKAAANTFETYDLFLFQEVDTVQKLLKSEAKGNYKLSFYLKSKAESPQIKALDTTFSYKWYLEDFNKTKDSLIFWLIDVDKDSLTVQLSDNGFVIDTVDFKLEKPKRPDPAKENKKKKPKSKAKFGRGGRGSNNPNALNLAINVGNNGVIDFFNPIKIKSRIPLKEYDLSAISLKEDTTFISINPVFTDSLKKKIEFNHKWKKDTKYQLLIQDSCLIAINNFYNDSIALNFTSSSPDDYAGFYLNFTPEATAYSYIIQLLDSKGKPLRQQIIGKAQQLEFINLKPGDYKVKLIEDRNKNGKWDTGDYLGNVQPEKVLFFEKTITIKAGWDVEEDWNLLDNSE